MRGLSDYTRSQAASMRRSRFQTAPPTRCALSPSLKLPPSPRLRWTRRWTGRALKWRYLSRRASSYIVILRHPRVRTFVRWGGGSMSLCPSHESNSWMARLPPYALGASWDRSRTMTISIKSRYMEKAGDCRGEPGKDDDMRRPGPPVQPANRKGNQELALSHTRECGFRHRSFYGGAPICDNGGCPNGTRSPF